MDDDDDDEIEDDDQEPEMRDEEQEELEPEERQLWGRRRPSRRCVRYRGRSLRCLRWSDEGPRRPATALPLPWWAFLWRG